MESLGLTSHSSGPADAGRLTPALGVEEMTYSVLDDAEYESIWGEFYRRFKFKPNYDERRVPAINEPKPSIVYSFAHEYDDNQIDELNSYFKELFSDYVGSDEFVYALDWQHSCYKFTPHEDFSDLPIGIFPDGDYFIFLGPNMKFGTFGHPWQNSLCIFGEEFVNAIMARRPTILDAFIRSNT